MSAPTQYGLKLLWGLAEVPPLPDGWTVNRSADSWVVAIDPNGNRYLIGEGVFYRVLHLGPRETRIETDNPIPIWPA